MKYRIALDYSIATGDLTPYFDALAEGRTLASACSTCSHVAFPARTSCQRCGCKQINWTELPGTATVLYYTDGLGGSFALVRFDGADSNSTVALMNPVTGNEKPPQLQVKEVHGKLSANRSDAATAAPKLRGSLVIPPGEKPGLWLAITTNHDKREYRKN